MPHGVQEAKADHSRAGTANDQPEAVEQHHPHEEVRHVGPSDPQRTACRASEYLASEQPAEDRQLLRSLTVYDAVDEPARGLLDLEVPPGVNLKPDPLLSLVVAQPLAKPG